MDSTTFIPMYDLEHLGEDQKATYYRDACNFLGIPANLNLLAYIEMVVGDSGRHLVLYAKKGATDLIRQTRGISTTSLEAIKDLVPGQVCFIAVGRDTNGREERAVGTADIEGLRGKDLSDAVMIAQTRATRRMTLQFVGGGILDESEIPSNRTALTNSSPLDAITAQPVVVPNPTPTKVEPPIPFYVDLMQHIEAPTASSVPSTVEPPLFTAAEARIVKEALAGRAAVPYEPTATQKEAQAALATVKPDVLATAAGESFKTVADLAKALPADNPLAQVAAEPPKQRKRKSAGITLDTPAQEASAIASPAAVTPATPEQMTVQAAVNKKLDEIATVIAGPVQANPVVPVQALPAQPVQPPAVQKLLNPDQEKEIKERLAKYRNELLPAGGMVPVDKVGGVEIQLRKFVGQFNPAKPSSKTWDYQDWLTFVGFLDETVKTRGAAGLVKVMQQAIGIIK